MFDKFTERAELLVILGKLVGRRCGLCEIVLGLIKLFVLVIVGGVTLGGLVLLVFDKIL